jgi:hypothetical protein
MDFDCHIVDGGSDRQASFSPTLSAISRSAHYCAIRTSKVRAAVSPLASLAAIEKRSTPSCHAYPHSSGGFLCDMRTNPELEHDAAEPQRLVA